MVLIAQVNRAYAKKQLKKLVGKATINLRGCIIPKRLPRKDGYVRWTISPAAVAEAFEGAETMPSGEQSFYVHQLAYYAENGTVPTRNQEHLSHLCNDSRCMNTSHLIVETPKQNNSRKNCRVTVECEHCCKKTNVCEHTPKCIPL
jgi:hypothetical protein